MEVSSRTFRYFHLYFLLYAAFSSLLRESHNGRLIRKFRNGSFLTSALCTFRYFHLYFLLYATFSSLLRESRNSRLIRKLRNGSVRILPYFSFRFLGKKSVGRQLNFLYGYSFFNFLLIIFSQINQENRNGKSNHINDGFIRYRRCTRRCQIRQ